MADRRDLADELRWISTRSDALAGIDNVATPRWRTVGVGRRGNFRAGRRRSATF